MDEEQKERFDFDGFWKDLIVRFWRELLRSVLPTLYAAADLTKEPEFLDKELRDVLHIPDDQKPPRFVDALLKIPLKDGGEQWVLLHIEVQGPVSSTPWSWTSWTMPGCWKAIIPLTSRSMRHRKRNRAAATRG